MLPSNQQHNTIYRYRSLFSGAQCEVSSINRSGRGRPRAAAAAPLARPVPPPGRPWLVGQRSWPGLPSPVVPLLAPAGMWKGPCGRRALSAIPAVPPTHSHPRPGSGQGKCSWCCRPSRCSSPGAMSSAVLSCSWVSSPHQPGN